VNFRLFHHHHFLVVSCLIRTLVRTVLLPFFKSTNLNSLQIASMSMGLISNSCGCTVTVRTCDVGPWLHDLTVPNKPCLMYCLAHDQHISLPLIIIQGEQLSRLIVGCRQLGPWVRLFPLGRSSSGDLCGWGGAWSEHVRQINVPHHTECSINEIIWNVTQTKSHGWIVR
jgi:hypothetical protein